MGYILPIEPYQQMNDQLRNIQQSRNVSSVEKPFPVTLEEKYGRLMKKSNQSEQLNTTPVVLPEVREQIAMITGKGRHVNEVV